MLWHIASIILCTLSTGMDTIKVPLLFKEHAKFVAVTSDDQEDFYHFMIQKAAELYGLAGKLDLQVFYPEHTLWMDIDEGYLPEDKQQIRVIEVHNY